MAKLRLLAAALCLGVATTTGAHALDDEIGARQQLMQDIKAAMGASVAMVKGEMEYDAKRAELAMRTMNAAAIGLPMFFTKDNSEDLDTEAGPKIWQNMDGFKTGAGILAGTSDAAAKKASEGLDAFKMAFGDVAKTCKGCHSEYRVEKK